MSKFIPDPQKKTIAFLKSIGYVLHRECVWPILIYPKTGKMMQIAFDGRQICLGWKSELPTID